MNHSAIQRVCKDAENGTAFRDIKRQLWVVLLDDHFAVPSTAIGRSARPMTRRSNGEWRFGPPRRYQLVAWIARLVGSASHARCETRRADVTISRAQVNGEYRSASLSVSLCLICRHTHTYVPRAVKSECRRAAARSQ